MINPETLALLTDIRAEITRLNKAAGETVFNPALTQGLDALLGKPIRVLTPVTSKTTNASFDPVALAERTSDAYSADGYTSWTACAKLLAKLGYDEKQAEAILRSKWTRWARDMWNGKGKPTSQALENFLMRYKYSPTHSEVIALTNETFS